MEGNFDFEPQESTEYTLNHFVLALLQVSAQVRINHWQTKIEPEHRNFGMFYEEFSDLTDTIVESILGKYGTEAFQFGEATLGVCDYSTNFKDFVEMAVELNSIFCEVFDRDEDSELYNEMDNIKNLINKFNYLMNQRGC